MEAVPIGSHAITAATGIVEDCDGSSKCLGRLETTNRFEVGQAEMALLVLSGNSAMGESVVLDKWGCLLVGGIVTGGGVSEQSP